MAMNLSGKRTRTRRNSGESCSITITATKGESRLIGSVKACEPVWCNFQVQGQRIPKRGSSVFFYVHRCFKDWKRYALTVLIQKQTNYYQ
ncbi:hypothetical protein AK833_10355 [Lysinibacillus sp. F5]|nr:hypothetical protein AK833_10355 [Lysinibacillus sp. F5]